MSGREHDVMALSGLRRLVLHARDSLRATTVHPDWTYTTQAWSPAQVRGFAARLLALEVLTLVADCLPAEEAALDEKASS